MPAAAIIGAGVLGAGATLVASSNASNAQTQSVDKSNALQQAMYNQTRADLAPYNQAGQQALTDLQGQMPYLTSKFNPTQDQLEQTPGYQFNLSQGLKAVNNAMGARGLLNSGAVMKGASNFATGLANSTWLDQFNADQTQKQNIYNKLMGVVNSGQNAAAQTGAYGTQTAANQAQGTIGAGNASAAASIASGNAISNAFGSVPSALLMNKLLSGGGGGLTGMYTATTLPASIGMNG